MEEAGQAVSSRPFRARESQFTSPQPLSPSDAERENAKLTAAINRAKDEGDIGTLREIADDPHGFILRQGWTGLDFSDGEKVGSPHPGPLPIRCGEGEDRLHETLQLEIITVLEALNRLRESPDYELCQLSERKPGMLEELAAERARVLEKESVELEKEASRLAGEIEELGGEAARIG